MRRSPGTPPRLICDEQPCPVASLSGPCHVFRGARNDSGYGVVRAFGKMVRVHRLAWEREVGPIPQGMVIDHQCRVRACCNVDHLRLVTLRQNNTENVIGNAGQMHAAKTHCPYGHPYTKENTMMHHGSRECLICVQAHARRRRERKS